MSMFAFVLVSLPLIWQRLSLPVLFLQSYSFLLQIFKTHFKGFVFCGGGGGCLTYFTLYISFFGLISNSFYFIYKLPIAWPTYNFRSLSVKQFVGGPILARLYILVLPVSREKMVATVIVNNSRTI